MIHEDCEYFFYKSTKGMTTSDLPKAKDRQSNMKCVLYSEQVARDTSAFFCSDGLLPDFLRWCDGVYG